MPPGHVYQIDARRLSILYKLTHTLFYTPWKEKCCLLALLNMGNKMIISYIIILIFTPVCISYPCAECDCQYLNPRISVLCMSKGLTSLPSLPEQISISVSEVYMNHNSLQRLDKDILDSWDLLTYLDLTDNPIFCGELDKINSNVEVIADCIVEPTTREYAYLYKLSARAVPITVSMVVSTLRPLSSGFSKTVFSTDRSRVSSELSETI